MSRLGVLPWVIPIIFSSVLHVCLLWGALAVSFAWTPPLTVFPIELVSAEPEPAPPSRPMPPPRLTPPPEPKRHVVPPAPTVEPPRPVESTANAEPATAPIEEPRPPATPPPPAERREPPAPPPVASSAPAASEPSRVAALENRTLAAAPIVDSGPAPAPVPAATGDTRAAPSPQTSAAARGPVVASRPPAGEIGAALPSSGPRGGYQVRPTYPSSARGLGIEGTTMLRVRVQDDGTVGEVRVQKSAGHPDLDQAAADAVRQWRFDPARKGGAAVAVWVVVPIEFRLTR